MARDEVDRQSAARAVARWSQFPVHADPRPIVLLEGALRAEEGFATADAKMAFLTGAIEARKGVPEEVIHLMRRSQVRARPAPSALRVNAAALAKTTFVTDRGRQTFAAWRVDADDTHGPIWVLAEEVLAHCWSPPDASDDVSAGGAGSRVLSGATLGSGDTDLAVDFVGGSKALLDYEAETIENAAAVAVILRERAKRVLAPATAITAAGHARRIRSDLSDPLGSRVLVNLDRTAVEVTARASSARARPAHRSPWEDGPDPGSTARMRRSELVIWDAGSDARSPGLLH